MNIMNISEQITYLKLSKPKLPLEFIFAVRLLLYESAVKWFASKNCLWRKINLNPNIKNVIRARQWQIALFKTLIDK